MTDESEVRVHVVEVKASCVEDALLMGIAAGLAREFWVRVPTERRATLSGVEAAANPRVYQVVADVLPHVPTMCDCRVFVTAFDAELQRLRNAN